MLFNNFINIINIICISGNGGNGKVNFKKKNKKKGKPDGGNGGNGGNIIFISDKNIFSFFFLKKIYKAENGYIGENNCKTGKNGQNCYIKIPINTLLTYKYKNIKKKIYFKKNNIKKKILLGGKGGKGNFFYKNSKNQKTTKYSEGKKGIKKKINLILLFNVKIGIIGLPNSGKSTILSLITNSKPKINNYLFTTIRPNLGIYNNKNYLNFLVMDIPIIIKNLYKKKKIKINKKNFIYIKKTKILLIIINYNYYKNFFIDFYLIKNKFFKNKNLYKKKKKIILISKYDLKFKKNNKNLFYIINFLKKKKIYFCFFSIFNKKKNIFFLKKIINKLLK
ncbi:MAG: 50S ribosome-binding GTPase [Candidatus Shikimatogenerans bostrichidophilus]|nr:MAG: 50S ribosome-binding GTPase [Candidatus Shikimatogenerans bostrichidophilus]